MARYLLDEKLVHIIKELPLLPAVPAGTLALRPVSVFH